MLLSIFTSVSSWLTQLLSLLTRQITHMQPTQYMIGLGICICLGYVLLRGRD